MLRNVVLCDRSDYRVEQLLRGLSLNKRFDRDRAQGRPRLLMCWKQGIDERSQLDSAKLVDLFKTPVSRGVDRVGELPSAR